MLNPTYLSLSRNHIYYMRWPLPRQLHPQRKNSSLKISLKTRDPNRALHLSKLLSYDARIITTNGIANRVNYADIRDTLHNHFADLLRQQERGININGPLSAFDRSVLESSAETATGIKGTLNIIDGEESTLVKFIDKYQLPIKPNTPAYAQLKSEMIKAYRDYCNHTLAYDNKMQSYDFGHAKVSERAKTSSPQITIGNAVTAYIEENTIAGVWVTRSKDQIKSQLDLLKEILGADRNIASLTATDANHTKDTVLHYPKNRKKIALTKDVPLAQLRDVVGAEMLSTTSINGYLKTFGGFFGWAKRQRYIQENLFSGLSVRKSKNPTVTRKPFTTKQVETIIYALQNQRDEFCTAEYQYWVTLIGIYTGARLNEICQLHTDDIKQIDSIWSFDLNSDSSDKKLKTPASARVIPLHSQLIELGFIAYLQQMQQLNSTRLFPELNYSPKHGWGRAHSRWFNDQLLRKLNMKEPELVFHSLRTSMTTALFHANVDEPIVQSILGHQREGVTQKHYHKAGYTLEQKKSAMEKVQYRL